MSEIAGVTRQREGQINNSETVGGVERSVNQSSHITEYWFNTHEKVKLRVLKAFLETAKIALRGNNKKVQYVLDDQTIQMLNMDGDMLSEADYGLVLTSSTKSAELEQTLKQYAQAFLQNGGRLSSIMDIYFSPSLSDMRRKLELAEDKIEERNAQAQEQANKIAQQQMEAEQMLEQAKLKLDEANNIRNNETAKYIAELKLSESGDGIIDESEVNKMNFDMQKHQDEKMIKIRDLDDKMKMHNDKMNKEDKKIAVQKQNKAQSSANK